MVVEYPFHNNGALEPRMTVYKQRREGYSKPPVFIWFDGKHYRAMLYTLKPELPKLTQKYKPQKERAPLHTLAVPQEKKREERSSSSSRQSLRNFKM